MAKVGYTPNARRKPMAIPKELLNALMRDYKNPEDLIGETGLLKQLTKQLLERAMQAEMTAHLGYEKNASTGKKAKNSRNGSYQKRLKGEFGNLDITVPLDRDASFEPVIIPKGQSRFTGFGDKISVSWYDFESREGEEFMAEKGINRHVPLIIWIDGHEVVKLGQQRIAFAGFPTGAGPAFFRGKWTINDLKKALDQATGKN